MPLELGQQDALLVGRLPAVVGRQVHQDQQHPRPFDVAEEPVPEALALARALDEPGDVGRHELVLVEAHHAQVGLQRRERVAGDLGLGRRDARDESRLAGIGEPNQGHVGHELQLQVVPGFLARSRPARRSSVPAGGWRGTGRCPCPPDLRRQPANATPASLRLGQHLARRGRGRPSPRATGTSRSVPARPCLPLP